eukprot:1083108_1
MIKYVVSACLLIKLSYGLIPVIPPPIEGDNCGIPGQDCQAIRAPSFLCPDGKTCWGNCGECTFEKNPQTGELECSPWKPEKRVCSNKIVCCTIHRAPPNTQQTEE